MEDNSTSLQSGAEEIFNVTSTPFSLGVSGDKIATMFALDDMNASDDANPFVLMSDKNQLQLYLRVTCLIFLFVIFAVGTIGNIMVTLVIGCSRDMRTSTNIFLVNLSIADLLVLVICTPTALIEVTHHHERWILGFYLCKFVPLLEAIVANASVLTILAISFERYYAICLPLRASSVCTKSRAILICIAAWICASFITSPMYFMISYNEGINEDGEWTARCDVEAGSFWPDTYTITTIVLFFLLPFFILLVTYGMIARRLTNDRSGLNAKNENLTGRKQVVTMLGTVVFVFFLCLLPFRVLTLFVVVIPPDHLNKILVNHEEAYYNFLYFSRIMVYLNSSLNPILYNIMSTKFRNGYRRLCHRQRKPSPFVRHGTFLTNTTTNSTSLSISLGNHTNPSIIANGKRSGQNSPELNGNISKKNGVSKVDGKSLKTYLKSKSNSHHGSNGLFHGSSGPIFNGIASTNNHSYHFHELPSGSFRSSEVRLHNHLNSSQAVGLKSYDRNNFNGTVSVKSDVIYSGYIPGKRSETVL